MAQTVRINGVDYPDVPAVNLPKSGGGTASFPDTSDATATADKIQYGYTAYGSTGEKLTGTRRVYRHVDANGDGHITMEEVT